MTDLWLWLDLETTGLDPAKDSIVEVGCLLTDPQLMPAIADDGRPLVPFEEIVWPGSLAYERILADPIVEAMHRSSGLLCALAELGADADARYRSIAYTESRLIYWLNAAKATHGEVVLAGSGVSRFDRRFIDRDMPKLASWLRYWSIDVDVLRRTRQAWGLAEPDAGERPHRALADARLHLEEARTIRDDWIDQRRFAMAAAEVEPQ